MQVNISTMNRSENEILCLKKQLNLKENKTLFINQCSFDFSLKQVDETTQVIFTDTIGISKSRNIGLKNAKEDIILIGDDDLLYIEGLSDKIEKSFQEYPEYSVICFKTNHRNTLLNKKIEKINYLNLSSVYSVQIAFRRKDILDAQIWFDENFGAGSGMFSSGEENIFIKECLDKGLKCIYLPIEILEVPESQSTWFCGFDESFMMSKGALFRKLYYPVHDCMYIVFLLIKYQQIKKHLSLFSAWKAMKKGERKLLNLR